ncbi:hypothetical protein AeRB84_001772 [Aphanomyces euteiches]|nr:hypothetical protein AeRB84_001772 [Aphanomyces euteiches]
MKKQLTKLFSRKKTVDESNTAKEILPVKASPPTPNVVPPFDARYARITSHMKDINAVCKNFTWNMKKVQNDAGCHVDKLVSSINAIGLKIQSAMGDTSVHWGQIYCSGEFGITLCEQTTLPALLVETLDLLRLHFVIEHAKRLGSTSEDLKADQNFERCVYELGYALAGIVANAAVMERYRCEIVNLLRMAADLYAPNSVIIREIVAMTITATINSTLNAGIVWYLHDAQAIASVVKTIYFMMNAPFVTTQNASIAAGTFHTESIGGNEEIEVHLAVSKALGLHKEVNSIEPVDEVRPAETTYSFSSHDPNIGATVLLNFLQASCHYSFILVQDFAQVGGYDVIWSLVRQDAPSGMEIFIGLLPLGEGVDKLMDWTLKKCGAWNDSAFIALRDYLLKHIENEPCDGEDSLIPYFNILAQVYTRDVENFKRLEPKTHILTSVVTRLPQLRSSSRNMVLACVEHIGVEVPKIEFTRDILNKICVHLTETKEKDYEFARLLCETLTKMLQLVTTSDHPLRDILLEFGLLDKGILPYFESFTHEKDVRVQIQCLSNLTRELLHNHVASCTQFRQLHVHSTLYRVVKERVEDVETFSLLFQVFIELAAVTKSTQLLQGIESDVQTLLSFVHHCRQMHESLKVTLKLILQYLNNNMAVQRIWRENSGLENLLSVMSSLNNYDIHAPHVKLIFDIFKLLLENIETQVYAKEHHVYHTIAECLVATGWMATSHYTFLLQNIFLLIFQPIEAKKVNVRNPDAAEMLFDIWPNLDGDQRTYLLDELLASLNQLTKPHEQKAALISAGIFRWIYPHMEESPRLEQLLYSLSTNEIPMPNLRDYFRVLNKTSDHGLNFLDTVSKAQGVPHSNLQHHSYIQVMSEALWPPASGYSFSCWFNFPPDIAEANHTVSVPMNEGYLHLDHGLGAKYVVLVGSTLSIYVSKEDAMQGAKEIGTLEIQEYMEEGIDGFRVCCNDDWFSIRVVDVGHAPAWKKALHEFAKPYVMLMSLYAVDHPQCFTRVYFDPGTTCLRIEISQKHIVFKDVKVGLFAENTWHHLLFTHRKSVMGSSLVTLYIDGGEVGSKKLAFPASTAPSPIRCFLGSDPHLFPSTCIRSVSLGPSWLISDVLPTQAAKCLFMLGPSYMNSFPGNVTSLGAIGEWTESVITSFLHWIIHRKVEIAQAAARLQLHSLKLATKREWQEEMVVSMVDEEDKEIWPIIWFRYFLDRYCSLKLLGEEWLSQITSFTCPEEVVMWSLHTKVPNTQAHMQFVETEPSIPLDLPRMLPTLGSLGAVLLPLADTLETSKQLHCFLRILNRSLKSNPVTMAWFLEQNGFRWITGFLLDRVGMIDVNILTALVKLAISGTLKKEFVLGQESDKFFVLCLATSLFRILLENQTCFSTTTLWKFLLQQRMGLVKELLIVEPKASLLNSMSNSKKESIDVLHNGFDQVLSIDSVNHVQYPIFFEWIQSHATLLHNVLSTRTDPIYQSLVETIEGSTALRHPKQTDWTVRVGFELPGGQSSFEWTAVDAKIEPILQHASEIASQKFEEFMSDQREGVKEAKLNWTRIRQSSKHSRTLWADPIKMRVNASQTAYQSAWEMTTLDPTEGPGRKRTRLKWSETQQVQQVDRITVEKRSSMRISKIQNCLEFHEMVEVYRQCMFKQELNLDQCKFPQTRDRLQNLPLSPKTIADVIHHDFMENDKYLKLGISSVVAQEVCKALALAKEESVNSSNTEFVVLLPSTLFDVADSEAMQKALIKPSAIKVVEEGNEGHESDEEFSDEEEDLNNRISIDGRLSETILEEKGAVPEENENNLHTSDHTYGGILRFLHRNDQPPQRATNAMLISGMRKANGLFLMGAESIYFIEGFILTDDSQTAKSLIDLRDNPNASIKPQPNNSKSRLQWRLKYYDIKQFYRIKFQLRPVGLEIVDTSGWTHFCTFESSRGREDVFKTLFQMPIHNSIYWAHVLRPGPLQSVKRLRQSLTKKWLRGALSNFDYLIELNALAGRTFNDVTQYPVFPWVLADYTSQTLDLSTDSTYRDLSKPMGALGEKRASQFQERYQAMASDGFDGSPAFHYGTHYSCSGYVTYYLLRLEPFSSMAKELQGGEFDKADRLFRSIGASWASASAENLQDVRELIPEFFFLPEFLINANRFDLGITQNGEVVNDVILPPWAQGDPREFIRLHRRALESKFVSENLHLWIDLIFGYKQRGQEAIDALNMFMHMTYEGTVDIDSITDPLLREATLAQIENFGQTPSKLFNSPHPQRKVPQLHSQTLSTLLTHAQDLSLNAQSSIEAYAKWHTPLAPPLVSIGKDYVFLKKFHSSHVMEEAIGDVKFVSDRYVCKGKSCALIPPRLKKYVDWGLGNGSIALRVLKSKSLMVIENLHTSEIRCGAFSEDGLIFVSGGDDTVVNILEYTKIRGERQFTHKGKLTGHDDAVTCICINKSFNLIVSGSKDQTAIVWDLRTRSYLRELKGHDAPLRHVGINGANGNLLTIAGAQVRIWSINGDLLAAALLPSVGLSSTSALCTNCDTWQNGVAVVTGHTNGTIACWGIQYPSDIPPSVERDAVMISSKDKTIPSCRLIIMKLLLEHRVAVTALTLSSDQRQLISGDQDGWCIRWVDDSLTNSPS